ncbi:branched-chain-amino-acid aminotransferas-like protein [Sporormia fimetaria CBS 119925]|uniref:Branched-chain-amino-acid aminotransferase n=1 Tax=Sporormia fimetaria CBS 119925 TaxID=1340428 RepID=A0A6A6UYP1_9PLEO|nr:branched-chain-amino-acid aminotransferas-like protein [Sporormia fimetaria CBS 119925]
MAPSALPAEQETVAELTNNGIELNVSKTAPSISKAVTPEVPQLAELDASRLEVNLTTSPRPVPGIGSPEMASQKTCTDHMITATWTAESGWGAPQLKPYGPFSLMPTSSVLHYATECFEGMKLYRGYDGKLRLFRPNLNCNRMLMSTNRIALPAFPPTELQKLIMALCAQDGAKWLPKDRPGHFLYIRPTMIGTDSALGVQRPTEAMLFILLTCFAPMDDIPGGMRLLASQDDMIRAWPGGFGYAKVGANYGPSLVAQGEARRLGYHQILWLFGEECVVTEAGASNFFVVWRTREGALQLVTADLKERIVLDGVTRRSVLEFAREKLTQGYKGLEKVEVVERRFVMQEVVEAAEEGRLVEAFGAGTAWFIAPVGHVHFRGRDFEVPMVEGECGRYTKVVKEALRGVMYGEKGYEGHEWGVVVEEK